MRRFVHHGLLFGVALAAIVAAFEFLARHRLEAAGQSVTTPEVSEAVRSARAPGPSVVEIVLGDSVARQFFPPGSEPDPSVRFLAANYAVTLAGNFYLLEDAFRACPQARDVALLVRPESLQANLDPRYLAGHFAAYFHSPAQMVEMWNVTRDPAVTLAQAGRWLLPGTLALNAAWRQEPRGFRTSFSFARASGAPDGVVTLSPLAGYFLERMRALVAARSGRLRVIAVPMPDDQRWADPARVLSGPITYLDRGMFDDGIHVGPARNGVRSCVGTKVAARLSAEHNLPVATTSSAAADATCEPL